jgi:tetratricopeptide (TPR) repeat protein
VAGNVVEELLGGGEEAPESEAAAAEAPQAVQNVGAEALAAAIAINQTGLGPEVAAAAEGFLKEQTRVLSTQDRYLEDQRELVRTQTHHLQQEHGVRLGLLRGQRLTQRLKIGQQTLGAMALTVVVVILTGMIYDAASSRAVVVDSFDAPPALSARGISGKAVASGVLDTLRKLQAATRSTIKGRDTTGAWSSDIKVEVPETGVSVGEVARILHERLGHDIHVEGELIQTETGGLALTVRGDGLPAKTFEGAAGDLDRLTQRAGEYVYGRSQPAQYAAYLFGAQRNADALAFLPDAYANAEGVAERATLANTWGAIYGAVGDNRSAVEKYRLAMSETPNNWKAWGNLITVLPRVEGEEAAWRESRAMLAAVDKAPANARPHLASLENPASTVLDMPLALRAALAGAEASGGVNFSGTGVAEQYGQMHDPLKAAAALAAAGPGDPLTKDEGFLLRAYRAIDDGAAGAVRPMEAFWADWQADASLKVTYPDGPCVLGLAYGLVGRFADAEAVFKKTGPWSRCYAFHGVALERAGDLAGAERMWAEGLRVGPDLPQVYLWRGMSETARGDFVRAGADLSTASAKAPHWADPLKAWGDLLARQGRWRDAVARYDDALKYAPAWSALHQARDAAARRAQTQS